MDYLDEKVVNKSTFNRKILLRPSCKFFKPLTTLNHTVTGTVISANVAQSFLSPLFSLIFAFFNCVGNIGVIFFDGYIHFLRLFQICHHIRVRKKLLPCSLTISVMLSHITNNFITELPPCYLSDILLLLFTMDTSDNYIGTWPSSESSSKPSAAIFQLIVPNSSLAFLSTASPHIFSLSLTPAACIFLLGSFLSILPSSILTVWPGQFLVVAMQILIVSHSLDILYFNWSQYPP